MKLSNLYTVIFLLLLSSCSKCNKKEIPPVSQTDVINAITQPETDSLKRVVVIKDSVIAELSIKLESTTMEAFSAKKSAQKLSERLKDALSRKDTASIISTAAESDKEFRDYVIATDQQDSVQTAIITSQAETIVTRDAQLNVEQKKSNVLNGAVKQLEVEKSDLRELAEKQVKKLNRSHFWNKVFGGTAVIGILYFLLTMLIP